jgi:hypothetical protein
VAGNDVLVIGPRAMTTGEERKDFHELYGDDPFDAGSVRAPRPFTSQMEKIVYAAVLLPAKPFSWAAPQREARSRREDGDIGKVDLDAFRRLS